MSSIKLVSNAGPRDELKRVKCSTTATLEWTIPDFVSIVKSRMQNLSPGVKKSSTFTLRCGQYERKFELCIHFYEGKKEIGFFLNSLNQVDVDVLFCLKAYDKSGNDFGNDDMEQLKLTAGVYFTNVLL
jgi:hypothetical protein